jgi:hypothetical protein
LTVLDTWYPDTGYPAGADVATVRAAIDALVGRHEALRTTYGAAADGRPLQFVREAPVLVPADLPTVPSVERTVALVRSEVGRREFVLDKEFPVRFALVVAGDVAGDIAGDTVRAVVVAIHHTVVDHHALAVLRHEFRVLVSGRALPPGEPRHPIDWAQRENSEAGRRQADRALAAIAGAYARLPASPRPSSVEGHRFGVLRVTSRQAAADVRTAAARHGVTGSSVLVAAYLVALAEVAGTGPVATRVAYSNRHLDNAQGSVACLVQDVVVGHDVEPGTRSSAVLAAVARQCFTRYAAGNYPYDRFRELTAGGPTVRTSINYVPPAPRGGAAPDDTLDWIDVPPSPGYVHDLDLLVVDTLHSLTFELNADTSQVAPASVEAIVEGMRGFLAGLADGTDPPLRVTS